MVPSLTPLTTCGASGTDVLRVKANPEGHRYDERAAAGESAARSLTESQPVKAVTPSGVPQPVGPS
ncbi:hypothetical protein TUSST3_77600 [Streptomyces sp. TUS-ST3]|nr:hypothetical protein TUSST3_77600 [Streptomyces sp. TUS-ST3]